MGAWGHGPLDSDQALDWYGDYIEEPIVSAIKKVCRDIDDEGPEYWGHELRAAAEVYVRMGGVEDSYGSDFDVNQELTERLQKLIDSNWHYEWNDPEEVKECILGQINQLQRLQEKAGKDVD